MLGYTKNSKKENKRKKKEMKILFSLASFHMENEMKIVEKEKNGWVHIKVFLASMMRKGGANLLIFHCVIIKDIY